MNKKIVVVDYNMGNIGSVVNMCKRVCDHNILVSSQIDELREADMLILPGVGNFGRAVENLDDLGLREILQERVLHDNTPILGICLGMQLLGLSSEEAPGAGLGLIDLHTVRFDAARLEGRTIPHMGWSYVAPTTIESPINQLKLPHPKFYHVHSYHVVADDRNIVLTTDYGYVFASGVQRENVCGVQFHPEKSHAFGMELLGNFCNSIADFRANQPVSPESIDG